MSLTIPITEAGAFFMKTDPVHVTLNELARRLDEAGIDYAIVGGMALGYHGFVRVTQDVDLLLTGAGYTRFIESLVGLGYVPLFPGARKKFKDTRTGVSIDIVTAGEYPGDGEVKPVAFPDPAHVFEVIDGVRVARLVTLIELKLASGMTAPHRLSDLGDVQRLIEIVKLPEDLAESLNPYVRDTYKKLWEGIAAARLLPNAPDAE
ncbi:MAG TPA: hypothetical protein VGV87_31405 [Blastocatellia bacterium]|nr:hypothetical protein [Blastocatellia bacterium]